MPGVASGRTRLRPSRPPPAPHPKSRLVQAVVSAATHLTTPAETRQRRMPAHRLCGRDPALVAARPVHGGLGHGAAVPARRHDLPRRRSPRRRRPGSHGRGPEGARASRRRSGLLGIGGLFGYHALYFAALRLAPPAEAGPHQLSLAASDRAVLRAPAGRAAEAGACRRARCSGFAGVVVLIAGRGVARRAGRALPGLCLRLRLRLRLGRLFGPVARASATCRPTRSPASASRRPR